MWIPAFISALLISLVLTSCSDKADSPRSDPPNSPSDAPPPSMTASSTATAPGSSSTEAARTEHRVYPFTNVDLRRLPVTRVGSDALSIGPPPRIPWIHPTPRWVYRLGGEVIPVPRGLSLHGFFADQYVLTGGCTRPAERCGDKRQGGLHLMSPDGTLTRLDHEPGRHFIGNVVTSPDGHEMAWVVDAPDRHAVYRLSAGDSAPTLVRDPARSIPGAFPRVVGFLASGDLLITVNDVDGNTLKFVRTSGKPADWDARSLAVAAPTVLLGKPAFTRPRSTCFSRYALHAPEPRWTRCYRWGHRPVDGFYATSVNSNGRLLITQVLDQMVIVDLRTGMPKDRIQFDHRVQGVRFEDQSHFLVVLGWEEYPDPDSWPIDRIVRCDVELECERVTADIEIHGYDMLHLIGD